GADSTLKGLRDFAKSLASQVWWARRPLSSCSSPRPILCSSFAPPRCHSRTTGSKRPRRQSRSEARRRREETRYDEILVNETLFNLQYLGFLVVRTFQRCVRDRLPSNTRGVCAFKRSGKPFSTCIRVSGNSRCHRPRKRSCGH